MTQLIAAVLASLSTVFTKIFVILIRYDAIKFGTGLVIDKQRLS